jgi:hypothetical protein
LRNEEHEKCVVFFVPLSFGEYDLIFQGSLGFRIVNVKGKKKTYGFLLTTLTVSDDSIGKKHYYESFKFCHTGLDSSEAGELVNFKEKIPQALLISEKGVQKKKHPESIQK